MPTLYRNGRLLTRRDRGASALLVDGEIITWLGADSGVDEHPGTTVIDLSGGYVTPAFVDAHVHATGTGLSLSGLDLSAASSLGAALDLVERAARAARGRPLIGAGWDETRWPEQRAPSARELDRAGYGGAVYLARVDAHSAVVSSALLSAVPGLEQLPGYRADGWLTRAAHDTARTAALAALTTTRIAELQHIALRHAASLGIACVHEMAGPAISGERDLRTLLELAAAEPLPEVIGYWGELFGIDTARGLGAVGAAGDLFCDGSLGSHTAALHEPYADQPETSGMLRFETGDLAEHIVRCTEAGLQAGFHAIGDAALDQVLDAVELASARLDRPVGAEHRVEHAEYVRDPSRLAASGLTASVQPMFDACWGGSSGMYASRLGRTRAAELNRFATLAAAGVPLAFGSDAPVTELGPWAAICAAVRPHDPTSGLSPAAAFDAHTRGGWLAARRAGEGVLAVGAPATFAVWQIADLDPTGVPVLGEGHELPTCLATVRRGAAIFDAGILAG